VVSFCTLVKCRLVFKILSCQFLTNSSLKVTSYLKDVVTLLVKYMANVVTKNRQRPRFLHHPVHIITSCTIMAPDPSWTLNWWAHQQNNGFTKNKRSQCIHNYLVCCYGTENRLSTKQSNASVQKFKSMVYGCKWFPHFFSSLVPPNMGKGKAASFGWLVNSTFNINSIIWRLHKSYKFKYLTKMMIFLQDKYLKSSSSFIDVSVRMLLMSTTSVSCKFCPSVFYL